MKTEKNKHQTNNQKVWSYREKPISTKKAMFWTILYVYSPQKSIFLFSCAFIQILRLPQQDCADIMDHVKNLLGAKLV